MRLANTKMFLAFAAGVVLFSSCKKELEADQPGSTTGTPPATIDKVKDTAIAYARDIYLWYAQIPATFNAQSYSDPNKIMEAIRVYSKEPGFDQPVDRWSFAAKKSDWDKVSSGVSLSFGLNVFFRAADDLRVKHIERASPAGTAGIRRGWRITKINGSSNINTNNIDFIVKNIFESSSTSFTFLKPDGTSTDITLTGATFQEHPVVLDSVYTVSSKKVGYMVFNSFLGDTSEINSEFRRVFTRFAAESVQDVVIDLRYNGGGYVSLQERLANYLINNAGNGGLMMTQQFNNKYASQYNSSLNFKKLGSLNLSRVFFIVSNNTASASELLINNLTPYMEVKVVGPSNTYGKPVGFFPISVGDWYIFPVSMRTTNKNGQGNYFNGIQVNKLVADGLDKDWGDVNEASFASTLKFITTGSFRVQSQENYRVNSQVEATNMQIAEPSFRGAIVTRKLK